MTASRSLHGSGRLAGKSKSGSYSTAADILEKLRDDHKQIPSMEANVTDESAIKSLTKLITSLEDNDDVQKVYFNCDLDLE